MNEHDRQNKTSLRERKDNWLGEKIKKFNYYFILHTMYFFYTTQYTYFKNKINYYILYESRNILITKQRFILFILLIKK